MTDLYSNIVYKKIIHSYQLNLNTTNSILKKGSEKDKKRVGKSKRKNNINKSNSILIDSNTHYHFLHMIILKH